MKMKEIFAGAKIDSQMSRKEARTMKFSDRFARVTHSARYDIVKVIAGALR